MLKKIANKYLGFLLLPSVYIAQSNPDLDKKDIVEIDQVMMNRSDLEYIFFIDGLWRDGFKGSGLFSKNETAGNTITTIHSNELKKRIKELQKLSKVDIFKYTGSVHAAVESYLRMGEYMGKIFALADFYAPLFENTFKKYDLPNELKYLAIVESSLNSRITSSSGAQGLWQFMPATARMYGLSKNVLYDERNDPIKSTEAAARYLKDLYDRFGNWALVLAAYNCGPGTVDRAITRYGTRDFWELSKFLPKETRNYIPKFIAINYVMNYYKWHHIKPDRLNLKINEISSVTVREKIHMGILAKELNISREDITFMNPQYNLNVVPAGQEVLLRLPKEKLADFYAKEMEIYAASQVYQISNQSKNVVKSKGIEKKNRNLGKKKMKKSKASKSKKLSTSTKIPHTKKTKVHKNGK